MAGLALIFSARGPNLVYVEHPLLRRQAIEERAYQVNIAATCLERSTLVVLPTGMGKTVIAALVVAETLKRKGGRVLFLAPTKPLVEQHAAYLRDVLLAGEVASFTGEKPPEDREYEWRTSKVVCSTPQVIENDLRYERISLEDVPLIVFDEAHRAVGDYAYVDVARAFRERGDGLALGITASPGSQVEKILEVCGNLGITGVEIRTEYDPDVTPYVHGTEVERIPVEVTEETTRMRDLFRAALDEQIASLRNLGYLQDAPRPSTKDILAAGRQIRAELDSGRKSGPTFRAATVQALAMKINHAIELVETQGLETLKNYVGRMKGEGGSRADRAFRAHTKIAEALAMAASADKEHPKVRRALWAVREQFIKKADSRVILFTHYRDMATVMERELAKLPGIRPARFVGQASRAGDEGLTQKEQGDILDKFRAGEVNVIVATSVAEEGLDIPQVDLVVFYEPVPSEIRTIQRRGRTGRRYEGRVAVLVTKDTRDEAYMYSARRKERKMHAELDRLRRELKQKIFVGLPGGETFVTAKPEERIASLRGAEARRDKVPVKPRPTVQSELPDS
ncbi:MAG: DEAD/DEAH box helicase [Methanobacteriota archaeon]|nr:MAG: DEAD/DEAH box helicase [Euryarchaeota archaeon]